MSSDSIKVAIKLRPLIKREKEHNLQSQWIVKNNWIIPIDQETRKRTDGFQFGKLICQFFRFFLDLKR